jgi:nucleotide-binding universal stress UspA family protein
MKNVFLLVHQDPGQEARLQVALDLTRGLGGHLTCIDVTPFPLVFDQGMLGASPVVVDEAEQETGNKLEVQRRLEAEDVSWTWQDLRDDFVPCLLEAASTADVIVLNRKLDSTSRPDMRAITSSVLTNSRALIVAVDETCRVLDVGLPALIAWDGSEQAMHALQRAVPLLSLASSIRILQAGPVGENGIAADEAARYLSRHGIHAEIEVTAASKHVADDIIAAAHRIGAGYCVMGAFGHSRFREAILGGVSHDMLSSAPLPLVMAH